MRRVPLFWLLCSCTFRPSVDAAMADDYLLAAMSDDIAAERVQILDELAALNFQLAVREPGAGKRGTTYPRTILLPPDFYEREPVRQLALLRHEAVHARQWRDLGLLVFGLGYARQENRWVWEMHGYRQTVRDYVAAGGSHEYMLTWIEACATTLPTSYHFAAKHRTLVETMTRDVLLLELARAESAAGG